LVLGGDALQGLFNRVTVQETAFFRHPQHFQALARDILPALSRPVTIWSAGCANGQEAFSLAMLLEEQGIDGRVIATDISTAALQRTAAARYTGRELSGLSPERIAGHLTRTADTWHVNKPIRDRVSTLRHNLLDPLAARGSVLPGRLLPQRVDLPLARRRPRIPRPNRRHACSQVTVPRCGRNDLADL